MVGETWIAAEYVLINRLVRLDDLVKASVGTGSYSYLTLRDAKGGSIMIQISTTLPRVRTQVVRGIVQALQRGMRIDGRTASTLGLRIWRADLKSP
ncbi:MAG TPA: hypothetical protein VGU71_20005 [Candidatus Dormibacteraeota bacterium]|nr:hypothetical protein [Candidatus Dormibacteraeota bacterium]